MLRKTFPFFIFVAAVLSGCANDPIVLEETVEKNNLFYEAKERTQIACVSMQALSVQHPMHSIIFDCPQLEAQVTTEQMKDAGWGIESIDVGQPVNVEGTVQMPLKLIIRKLK